MKDSTLNFELPLFRATREDPNVDRFLRLLENYDHLTRKQFHQIAGWSEREVRAMAEAAGSEVIRGQKGFSLFAKTGATEILDAAEDAISQGKKMIRYGVTLKTKLHHQVG